MAEDAAEPGSQIRVCPGAEVAARHVGRDRGVDPQGLAQQRRGGVGVHLPADLRLHVAQRARVDRRLEIVVERGVGARQRRVLQRVQQRGPGGGVADSPLCPGRVR